MSAMTGLLLKRSGSTGYQYEVFAGDEVVGHIRMSTASPGGLKLSPVSRTSEDPVVQAVACGLFASETIRPATATG